MIDIERIIGSLLDAENEITTLTPSASPQALRRVHEEENLDDEETIKDILGPDYRDPAPAAKPLSGDVERFGRWANVTMGDLEFCVSYLTPVAYYRSGEGIKITERDWSTTTSNHIAKWAAEIGMTNAGGVPYKYRELLQRFPRIPQNDITQLFRQEATKVDWNKRQMHKAVNFRDPKGYKYVDQDQKIQLPKYTPPAQEI